MSNLPTRTRRGYVLLLVLFVLALAAVAMAAVARLSLERSLQASRAEADLQRRWAIISCRAVLLPKADAALSSSGEPVSEVRRELRLGNQAFTLIFGDEQAKANVNLLYAQSGLAGAERQVRSIVEAAGGGVPVELRPVPGRGKAFGTPDAEDEPPAFETFGQVFARSSPEALTTALGRGKPISAGLTCWGDGTLNLRKASNEAVRAACGRHLTGSEITKLLAGRAKNPDLGTSELLDELKLSEARRTKLEDLLVDESSCHSLWIISRSGERRWYDLAISGDGAADVVTFRW